MMVDDSSGHKYGRSDPTLHFYETENRGSEPVAQSDSTARSAN